MGSFETLPIKEIDKIYEEALNFYKNFYTAERMNLMLICNKSLQYNPNYFTLEEN